MNENVERNEVCSNSQKGKSGTRKKRFSNRRIGSKSKGNRDIKGKDRQVSEERPGGNNPRWWGTSDFVKSVGQFNFASPLGKPIPFQYYNAADTITTQSSSTEFIGCVPGVMAIDVLPTIGIAETATDAVNTFVRAVYTKLRSTNNQSAPYAAPDLGHYFLAIDSIHMIIEQLVRVYGIARTYSPMNRYLPQALIAACGINPNASDYNLYANMADFRAEILNLMLKIQTLAIPMGMNLNERHRELVKYIYTDGVTSKAQIYLFRTAYLYKYNETYSQEGGGLNAVSVPMGSSAAQWITLAHELIDKLLESQFFAIVSGDIIKSFGYDKLFRMQYIDDMYSVAPVNNPEILLEIHNMRLAGDRYDTKAFDVYQRAGFNELVARPYCRSNVNVPIAGGVFPIIDVPVDNPDPDTVMIATRLTHCGKVGWDAGTSTYKYVPSSIGSELPIRLTIYLYNEAGVLQTKSTESNVLTYLSQWKDVFASELYFDWHPMIYTMTTSEDHLTISLNNVTADMANYTVMAPSDITKLHDMAIYGSLTITDVDTVGMPK